MNPAFDVEIKNNYFERLDSVYLDTFFSNKLDTQQIVVFKNLPFGKYTIKATTQSALLLKTTIQIQGTKKNIFININKQGIFELN